MKTKFLIEMETDGIPNMDTILVNGVNRFSDCFTNAGVNVKSCVATLQQTDPPEMLKLSVRIKPPVLIVAEDD